MRNINVFECVLKWDRVLRKHQTWYMNSKSEQYLKEMVKRSEHMQNRLLDQKVPYLSFPFGRLSPHPSLSYPPRCVFLPCSSHLPLQFLSVTLLHSSSYSLANSFSPSLHGLSLSHFNLFVNFHRQDFKIWKLFDLHYSVIFTAILDFGCYGNRKFHPLFKFSLPWA